MPKTPVNKYDGSPGREDQIGFARQSASTKPVAVTLRVQGTTQEQFGRRVFAPDSRHHAATSSRINNVGHALA